MVPPTNYMCATFPWQDHGIAVGYLHGIAMGPRGIAMSQDGNALSWHYHGSVIARRPMPMP